MPSLSALADQALLFSLWRTSIYHIYQHNLLERARESTGADQRDPSPSDSLRRKLLATGPLARRHSKLLNLIYYYLILKYLALIALDLDALAEFRLADCLLLGRFTFVGRTSILNKYTALCFLSATAAYRWFMLLQKPKFRYQCVDFLLAGQQGAWLSEVLAEADQDEHGRPDKLWRQSSASKPAVVSGPLEPVRSLGSDHLYFLPDRFANAAKTKLPISTADTNLQLRLNRGSRDWTLMASVATFLITSMALFLFLALLLLWHFSSPFWFTQLGFQLNYRNCDRWLRSHASEAGGGWPEVLRYSNVSAEPPNPAKQPFLLPWADLVPSNCYHVARILLDLAENCFIYLDVLSAYGSHTSIVILITLDIVRAHNQLKRRLSRLHGRLCCRSTSGGSPPGGAPPAPDTSDSMDRIGLLGAAGPWERRLKRELSLGQQFSVDYFELIQQYNPYISFHSLFSIALWLLYSALLCVWSALAGVKFVQPEFYIAELIIFIWTLIILGAVAHIRYNGNLLHAQFASFMALDPNLDSTKGRWTAVLNYYRPAPLYCFTILRAIEISWLFLAKLVAWFASVLLVLISFFHLGLVAA